MESPLISIIVPVYNVKKYLYKCINSIIPQLDGRSEVLLIDDGSTDGSGNICDELEKKSAFIRTYHKSNGGLSDARNYGIEKSSGKYLMFVDSDDYLEEGSLANFYDVILKYDTDVIVSKSYAVDERGNAKDEVDYSIKGGLYDINSYFKAMRKNPKSVIFCAQYFICKKSLVLKEKLTFKFGVIHEDELWTAILLLKCNNVYYLDYYFYYHLMRDGSIMHSNNFERSGKSLLTIGSELDEIYRNEKRDIRYLKDRLARFYLQAFPKLGTNFLPLFNRKLPLRNSYYLSTKSKALFFLLFPNLYYKIWRKKYKDK